MPYGQVIVSTTPTQIVTYNPKRTTLIVRNVSGSDCYISDSQQNITSKGFLLSVGEVISFVKKDGDQPEYPLYAQTTTGTADIRWIEQYGEG